MVPYAFSFWTSRSSVVVVVCAVDAGLAVVVVASVDLSDAGVPSAAFDAADVVDVGIE